MKFIIKGWSTVCFENEIEAFDEEQAYAIFYNKGFSRVMEDTPDSRQFQEYSEISAFELDEENEE